MTFQVYTSDCKFYNPLVVVVALVMVLLSGCVNPGQEQNIETELRQTDTDQSEVVAGPNKTASLKVDVINVNEARNSTLLREVLSEVNNIYRQCRIEVLFDTKITSLAEGRTIDSEARSKLAQRYKEVQPAMFFVPGTAEADVAFAHLPSLNSPAASTIWITDRVNEGCLGWIAAHEIGHVLLNSGKHSNGSVNVMSNGCTISNWSNSIKIPEWRTEQCIALHQSPFLER